MVSRLADSCWIVSGFHVDGNPAVLKSVQTRVQRHRQILLVRDTAATMTSTLAGSRLMSDVMIDADAVSAHQGQQKLEKVPLNARRLESLPSMDIYFVENNRQLFHQRDVGVTPGILDHLGGTPRGSSPI